MTRCRNITQPNSTVVKSSAPTGVALISGGLDSILAVELLRRQGINLQGIVFTSHFFFAESALALCERHQIPCVAKDISAAHWQIVCAPPHGYGKNMNPCIDCHILMLQVARSMLDEYGAEFVVTGEVVGQRPMSQNSAALRMIEKESGLTGRLLRPLSARLLTPTVAETEGVVPREAMLDIAGRSRRRQEALAREWGITEYKQPAGGCLLTEPDFSRRLRDLLGQSEPDVSHVPLLRYGRHFRLPSGSKVIVARDADESDRLASMAIPSAWRLNTDPLPGPEAWCWLAHPDELLLAAGVVARYANRARQLNPGPTLPVNAWNITGATRVLQVEPVNDRELAQWRI